MYGFESTRADRAASAAPRSTPGGRSIPADIAAALARAPRPRMLVTTPFHLKTLLDAGVALPPVDLIVCATAPLSPQLAARAEAALGAPLVEIYGCTEAGQVATRRTTAGAEWRTFDGLRARRRRRRARSSAAATCRSRRRSPTCSRSSTPQRFRLLGRSNDLINIAGKRSSIGHLNFHLNAIDGVVDGAFWMPPEATPTTPASCAWSRSSSRRGSSASAIVAALRERVDAAFLPRRIVQVDALPREPTGKLPAARLAALRGAARWRPRRRRRTLTR